MGRLLCSALCTYTYTSAFNKICKKGQRMQQLLQFSVVSYQPVVSVRLKANFQVIRTCVSNWLKNPFLMRVCITPTSHLCHCPCWPSHPRINQEKNLHKHNEIVMNLYSFIVKMKYTYLFILSYI